MTQPYKERSDAYTSGQVDPKWAGLGCNPNKQFFIFPQAENMKNVHVASHMNCLRFSGRAIL